jgi:hypothetical protein
MASLTRHQIALYCIVGLMSSYGAGIAVWIWLCTTPPSGWPMPDAGSIFLDLVMLLALFIGAALVFFSMKAGQAATGLRWLLLAASPLALGEISFLMVSFFRPTRLPILASTLMVTLCVVNFVCWVLLIWFHLNAADRT